MYNRVESVEEMVQVGYFQYGSLRQCCEGKSDDCPTH
jgi:hypothetical protein